MKCRELEAGGLRAREFERRMRDANAAGIAVIAKRKAAALKIRQARFA